MRMLIEDVMTISGRGTVVTGVVREGRITLGSQAVITTAAGEKLSTVIKGIEMSRRLHDAALDGDKCGILVSDITRKQVNRGDVLTLFC